MECYLLTYCCQSHDPPMSYEPIDILLEKCLWKLLIFPSQLWLLAVCLLFLLLLFWDQTSLCNQTNKATVMHCLSKLSSAISGGPSYQASMTACHGFHNLLEIKRDKRNSIRQTLHIDLQQSLSDLQCIFCLLWIFTISSSCDKF